MSAWPLSQWIRYYLFQKLNWIPDPLTFLFFFSALFLFFLFTFSDLKRDQLKYECSGFILVSGLMMNFILVNTEKALMSVNPSVVYLTITTFQTIKFFTLHGHHITLKFCPPYQSLNKPKTQQKTQKETDS